MLNSTEVAAPTLPSGNHRIVRETVMIGKRSEMERYSHKSVDKEQLSQWNLGQILPVENHTTSYGNPGEFNFGTKNCDENFTAAKAEVVTELEKWLDRESSGGEMKTCSSWSQKNTDGSASVVQNLAEQVDKIDVFHPIEPDTKC
ncbi:hypothetical protein GUJ93_ZPchr0011g28607 [Zizania palustris]|uniref:Uncharacterized protein n=1 Tax=Zizania palustris TaxID=103762 RepID=A0A8J6BTK5_ZIZPA|nr:hypothetical protein GUJ93_ZPchr0011g28607 [Zizania palustris]